MGMFDELVCKMELPGQKPDFVQDGHLFQTKDLDCDMDVFRIDESGVLDYEPPFTGELEFYASNIVGAGCGFQYTKDGEDAESVTYVATVRDGLVISIQQTCYKRSVALSSAEYREVENSYPEVPDTHIDGTKPLVGCTLFVQYGGGVPGYCGKVVYQNPFGLVLETAESDATHRPYLEVHDIGMCHLLFESKEVSAAHDKALEESRNWKRQELERRMAAKKPHTRN